MLTAPPPEISPHRTRAVALIGARRVAPLLAGVAPLGFAIGAAGSATDLPPLVAWASAVVVYGGSIQLVVLRLVDSGAAPAVIVMGALLSTLPRCLYALVIGPGFGSTRLPRRALDAYLLVEPSFAISSAHQGETPTPPTAERRAMYLGAGIAVFATWMVVTGLGAAIGGQLPTGLGIELLVPVMMLALAVGTDRSPSSWVAATVGGATGLTLTSVPHHMGFLVAVAAGVAAAMAVDRLTGIDR
jgi:predicted branched-subunit amino acid permease